MTFLLGGFLNAANKVLPVEPEECLHKKRPSVWEDTIFQKIFNKKLIDVVPNLTIDISMSEYIGKHEYY